MRVLTAREMAAVDRRAIEEIGIPGMVLMENAAAGVVEAVAERFPTATRVAIFCGPGNNGGDGFAVARLLDARGYRCHVFAVEGASSATGDAGLQLAILERLGLAVERLRPEDDVEPAVAVAGGCDLVIDGLFGTGLSRALEGHFAALVEALGELRVPVVAIDLPSGLDGSRAEIPGPTLAADLTVTFAAPKVAHVFAPAAERVGELVVAELGIPPRLVDEAPAGDGALHLLVAEEIAAFLPPRVADTHKGSYGHVLLVAGSAGKAGAAILAARGALRGGAGLVTAAVPAPLLATVDGGSWESMTVALPTDADGDLGEDAVAAVRAAAAGKDAVGLGPGVGRGDATGRAVRRLVLELPLALVVDADGLGPFAGDLAALRERPAATVLTPHPGELARLLGLATGEIQADRLGAARRAAAESGAVVVLKGHRTLVAAPDGTVWVNPTGNAGMASGGTGDVLTGLVAALLGQRYDAEVAAQIAVFVHGLAGDLAAEALGERALLAGDLLDCLPAAFQRLSAP